ncbi:MAG: hypothetical protein OQK48_04235 [Sulfurimonas sp.]|uniref:hypothetical protein n=1 Tax=Sulfurimonas sp. TaxID=2022749 RepID=UPI002613680E|nr:hypothetical protein [Sulfurimonas sp.]MCW8895805.1 hypothetical protein [Sulfurimonas sp.]MCW8954129.1 hypothetical protein [Sulfurimonas sp.]
MVRTTIFIILFSSILGASSFEQNCLNCHGDDFKFNMMMKKYTLKYSSEKKIKKAIFEYLKNPTFEKSILPVGYLNRFGIKEKTSLDDKLLKEMIDVYYDKFNMNSKLY